MKNNVWKKILFGVLGVFAITFIVMGAYRLANKTYDKVEDKLNQNQTTQTTEASE